MKSTDSWHCYLAHGLRLRSAIELPLPPSAPLDSSRPPDVVIRYGDVPAALRQPIAKRRLTSVGRRGFWEATRSAFLMDVENAGRFHVEGGREVRLRPNASLDEVGQLLVRVLLPLLLQQRGLTTLHASAVATSAGAVLFLGPSGAGKSSLASALTELGHPLLGDDLMALEKTADGRTKVLPAAPQTKLRPDAAEHLGLRPKVLGKACAAGKLYVQSARFHSTPLPLRAAYLLETAPAPTPNPLAGPLAPAPAKEFAIEPLSALDAFRALSLHTYKRIYLDRMGRWARTTEHLMEVAKRTSLHRLTRPAQPLEIRGLAAAVAMHLADAGASQAT